MAARATSYDEMRKKSVIGSEQLVRDHLPLTNAIGSRVDKLHCLLVGCIVLDVVVDTRGVLIVSHVEVRYVCVRSCGCGSILFVTLRCFRLSRRRKSSPNFHARWSQKPAGGRGAKGWQKYAGDRARISERKNGIFSKKAT